MIISESQHDNSKASMVGSDGSLIVSDDPLTPPPYSPSSSAAPSSSIPTSQPSCNYLLDHKPEGSLKGTWRVDTSLHIPESLLPPITDFDGLWNKEVRKARKSDTPFPSEVRPNLMIVSGDGSVQADVQIVSNNGDPVLIVAESKDGSVHLTLDALQGQVSRVHAVSGDGQVKVWIPPTFEGALTIGTSDGAIQISDGIKAKLTTFSSKSGRSRGFIGDWQSTGFGTSQSASDGQSPTPDDPFATWPGSAIHIYSKDGSVSLALIEEKPVPGSPRSEPNPFKAFFGGLFGWSTNANSRSQGGEAARQHQPGSSNQPAHNDWPLDRKELPPTA